MIFDAIFLAVVSFALFELSLNILVALMNGKVARVLNSYWKHWIAFVIFTGALSGPPIAAWAVLYGSPQLPAAFASISLVLAGLWAWAATQQSQNEHAHHTDA